MAYFIPNNLTYYSPISTFPSSFLLPTSMLLFCYIHQFIVDFLDSTYVISHSIQFSSVTQSCPTLCDPMDCSMPGLPFHLQFPELTQTHVHWVGVTPTLHVIISFNHQHSFTNYCHCSHFTDTAVQKHGVSSPVHHFRMEQSGDSTRGQPGSEACTWNLCARSGTRGERRADTLKQHVCLQVMARLG